MQGKDERQKTKGKSKKWWNAMTTSLNAETKVKNKKMKVMELK